MRFGAGLTQYAGNNQEECSRSKHDQHDQDSDPKKQDFAFIFGLGRSDSYHIVKNSHDLQKILHNRRQEARYWSKDSTP